MIDGRGNILGRWVIERVDEKQSVFADAGVPRKQEFINKSASLHRRRGNVMTTIYVTRTGDTIDYIAWKFYGTTANQLIEGILLANPRPGRK